MRLAFFGYPRIQRVGLAILCGVSNRQMCSSDFLAADVLLADFCLGLFILHNNFIHRTIFADSKGHIFCGQIAIRSGDFYQPVSCTSGQNAFQIMRLIGGCPAFNQLTICIIQGELCTWQFFASCQILLADGYLCGVVLHGYSLQLAVCTNGKGNIFCICITIRSTNFMQRIGFACGQFCFDVVCICTRYPFFYHAAILIQNLEGCSRDFIVASDVLLADGYLGRIIFHENRTIDIFAVYGYLACCIHNKFNGFCNRVTIWSGFFCQGICASIQLNGLWCLFRYPFCNGLAVCIGNLQACTFEFFRAIDCTLADDNITQRCIIHGYLTIYIFAIYQNLAGLVNGKGNGFCNLIAIRSGDFHQFVSAASNQCTFYHVCFCARCPSIHFQCNFALIVLGYIVQFQLCTSQFIRTSHCLFADGYLCDIILHDDNIVFILVCCIYCDCAVLFNRKGDIFGIRITIRSVLFVERIGLTCNQLSADVMRLVGGCPFFDDIIVFILNLEGCSRYFVLTGNISLVNGYLCDIIFHDDHAVFVLVCCVYCNCAVLFNRKGEIFSIRITIRSILFVERIGLTCNQLSADVMRLVGGCPFFDDIIVFILNLEGCSRYFVLTGNISLVNGYLCDIIFHDDHAVFVLVCCVYCNCAVLFNRKGEIFGICIAIRSSNFFQRISSAWQANNVLCSIAGCPLNTIAHCCQICVCSSNCIPLFCGQVIIGQGQGCSCNFVFASDVPLVNLDCRTFVLDGQGLSIFGLFNFAVCYFRYGCYNAILYNKGKGGNRCESVRSCDFFQFIRAIRQSRNGNISLECCGCRIFCNLGCTNLNTVQRCMFIFCSQLEFCFFCCNVSAVKCFLVNLNGACFVGNGNNRTILTVCGYLIIYRYCTICRNGYSPFLCRCEVTSLSGNFGNFISSSR